VTTAWDDARQAMSEELLVQRRVYAEHHAPLAALRDGIRAGDDLVALLREAYTRLMVSEGDARYIAANVELAERVGVAIGESSA
jgi:hypothetical protein